MTPQQLIERFEEIAPKAVRARRRVPGPVRSLVKMKQDPPFEQERFSMGYIYDTLSTRDPWTHRLDISRATGRTMVIRARRPAHR